MQLTAVENVIDNDVKLAKQLYMCFQQTSRNGHWKHL
jgi:hypothetical protein